MPKEGVFRGLYIGEGHGTHQGGTDRGCQIKLGRLI
jgi:hypothetical protein